jgi:hypothetical protein
VTEYLLVKRGLYYGPDNQGYTGVKAKAGRYMEGDARPRDGVTAIHEDEAPMFAPACWQEVKVEFLLSRIAVLEDALRPFARPSPHKNERGQAAVLIPATVQDVRCAKDALAS